jgi:hypothetical protein
VDILYSAYETMMRFGSGPGSIVIPVRWYRTILPPLPFPTVYNAHRWALDTEDERAMIDRGQPGEVWGEQRRWVKIEDVPVNVACRAPKGSREAWLGSYIPGLSPLFGCPSKNVLLADFNCDFSNDFLRVPCCCDTPGDFDHDFNDDFLLTCAGSFNCDYNDDFDVSR